MGRAAAAKRLQEHGKRFSRRGMRGTSVQKLFAGGAQADAVTRAGGLHPESGGLVTLGKSCGERVGGERRPADGRGAPAELLLVGGALDERSFR